MGVSKTVERTLRALPQLKPRTKLWINSVCINQADVEERAMEVTIAGASSIGLLVGTTASLSHDYGLR